MPPNNRHARANGGHADGGHADGARADGGLADGVRAKDGRADDVRASAHVALRGIRRWRLPPRPLRDAVFTTLAEAAPHVRGEITLVFTGDREIARLNRTYCGKDRPTDVLSFHIGEGLRPDDQFGDVVISVETARRQARDYDAPLLTETQRLIVHGVLHLCGYDHHERREAARMHGLTRRVLYRLRGGARAQAAPAHVQEAGVRGKAAIAPVRKRDGGRRRR